MCSAASPGPSISEPPVLVFDLDETILAVNSFPIWVRYMISGKFALGPFERASLRLRTIMVMLRRKAGLLDHAEAKRRLQRLWGAAIVRERQPIALGGLQQQLLAAVRPNMQAVLGEVRAGRMTGILATAAAADYAEPLGNALGFTHIVCTPKPDAPDYSENLSAAKRDRVLARIAELELDGRRIVFLTDHRDDLPMILESERVLWFGSEEKLIQVRIHASSVDMRSCAGLSAQDVVEMARR